MLREFETSSAKNVTRVFLHFDIRCSKISRPEFFLCMSFSSAQRSCHELLHWFVTKSVRAIFLSYRRKMFQRVGSRAFLHTTSALKMTIPDLVRMCKRDTL